MIGATGYSELKEGTELSLNIELLSEKSFHKYWYKSQEYKDENLNFKCTSLGLNQKNTIKTFDQSLIIGFVGELYNNDSYEENFFDYIRGKYLSNPEGFLKELNGTFSLIIYDKKNNRTIIAVDRVASKPIFYSKIGNKLVFSSYLKSFSNIENIEYNLNISAIADVLSHGFILNNNTFFKEINELPNGHYINIVDGNFEIVEYWNFNFIEPLEKLSEKEYANKLKKLLHKSVKRRIRHNVPSGILLSGGVDSRAILNYYKKHIEKPVTICYGYNREKWQLSDADIAKQLASAYNCEHHEIKYDLSNYTNTIKKVSELSGSLSRVLPEFEVYEKIRDQIGVHRVFSGDNNFGRFSKFLGDDEQMLEIANYINYFQKYKLNQFPLSDKMYKTLCNASKENIDNLLNACDLEDIHDRKDFFFLNAYMISLIGKDRMTISSELEIINPWYDSELLDFIKTLPRQYRMDKVLFKKVVKEELKNAQSIKLARTVTKPEQDIWENWSKNNSKSIYESLLVLSDLGLIDKSGLKKLFKIPNTKNNKSKSLFHKINQNLPLRNRYNWVNTKAPNFVYNNLVSVVEFISNSSNYLIYKGFKKKKQKQVNSQSLIVSLMRLNILLKDFKVKSLIK